MKIPCVIFKPEVDKLDIALRRADDHAGLCVYGNMPAFVLRDLGESLIVCVEIDGYVYVDRVSKDLTEPVDVDDDRVPVYLTWGLAAYDEREQKIAEAVRKIPHVPGYYWAVWRDTDDPVLVQLCHEGDIGNGLVAYIAGNESSFDLDRFYSYDGPLRPCPVWLQRGIHYGKETPPAAATGQ